MTRARPCLSLAALTLAAATLLATGSARAQGTEEQQEACTPDAIRLCQATIPDIPKTTACMKAHYAQLSRRCRLAFNDATGGASPAPAAADSSPAAAPAGGLGVALAPLGGLAGAYAEQIRGYCHQGLIDPFTCHNTLTMLHAGE